MAKHIVPIDVPEDLAHFAEAQVAGGRFASVEDVLRAGQKALERQQRSEAKIAALDAALEEGERSGIADDYSLDGTLAKLGLGQAAR
jgi:antitoxin ParD1/3/4